MLCEKEVASSSDLCSRLLTVYMDPAAREGRTTWPSLNKIAQQGTAGIPLAQPRDTNLSVAVTMGTGQHGG